MPSSLRAGSAVGLVLALALAAGASGCDPTPAEFTPGELGRVEFQYTSNTDIGSVPCFTDCGLDWPMMAGSSERIRLRGWFRMPAVVASSSDPRVFTVLSQATQCGSSPCPDGEILQRAYNFQVQAIAAGEAELSLRTSDGSLFDQVKLQVGVPDRLYIVRQIRKSNNSTAAGEVSSIDLELYGAAGENGGSDSEAPVWVRARDEHGRPLMNSYGITKRIDNETVAGTSPVFAYTDATAAQFDIVPRAIGSTVLNLSAGTVSLSVPINVR